MKTSGDNAKNPNFFKLKKWINISPNKSRRIFLRKFTALQSKKPE